MTGHIYHYFKEDNKNLAYFCTGEIDIPQRLCGAEVLRFP